MWLRLRKRLLVGILLLVLGSFPLAQSDPLPSWNEGATKKSILDFVAKVTAEGSPTFVNPAERIATFDNDGTLWAEKPTYAEFQFSVDRVRALAPQHPEWKTTAPFNRLLSSHMTATQFMAGGEKATVAAVAASHAGMTPEAFDQIVKEWLATAKHPTRNRLYTQLVYQPMLELLAYLRAKEFKTFIVSGGGVEFMRAFAGKTYGVPPHQVVGSEGKLKFVVVNGKPALFKLPDVHFIDDKAGKPVGIEHHIGLRPIAAFGNSDGDVEMLRWTCAGSGPRYCLLVHHDDAVREWAYDRTSDVGRLDVGLDLAKKDRWTLVSMKDDWKTIFPPEK